MDLGIHDRRALVAAAGLRDGPAPQRAGRPTEFASVVAFLCSEKAGYVTGTSLMVAGGFIKAV